RPSSRQYPMPSGIDEIPACPIEMSMVVGPITICGTSAARPAGVPVTMATATAATNRAIRIISETSFDEPLRVAIDVIGLRPEHHLPVDELEPDEDGHPEGGENDEHREHLRDVQGGVRGDDQEAEPGFAPDELAHDRPQDAEDDGDVEAGEDERQGVGKSQIPEDLPLGGRERAQEIELARVAATEPDDHVHQDWKERDHSRDDHLRRRAIPEPDHDEGRDRDLGHGLERDKVRIQRTLEQPELGYERADDDAGHRGDTEPTRCLPDRDQKVREVETAGQPFQE